nr:hypothetical protein GCM10017745_59500 [Saccharothrix mutabilis subsp. capreolus]
MTQNVLGGVTSGKPSLRRRFAMTLAADPGRMPTFTRVSNTPATVRLTLCDNTSSHSRTPRPGDTSGPVVCSAADARVPVRLRPNACVGAPTTSSSTSSGSVSGARDTSTTSTSNPTRPRATASAMVRVLPNIDS